MTQQQIIREIKLICIEEAARFEVPPVIIEIELCRKILSSRKWRVLLPDYLKDGPLYRFLFNWKGAFNVKLCQTIPEIEFTAACRDTAPPQPRAFRWEELTHLHHLPNVLPIKDEIVNNLASRIVPILSGAMTLVQLKE